MKEEAPSAITRRALKRYLNPVSPQQNEPTRLVYTMCLQARKIQSCSHGLPGMIAPIPDHAMRAGSLLFVDEDSHYSSGDIVDRKPHVSIVSK